MFGNSSGLFSKGACALAVWCLLMAFPTHAKPRLQFLTFEDPPYVFSDDSSEPGLVVRYVDALLKRAKQPYDLRIMPIKRAELQASATENTCVFPIERNQEREVQFSWVSPILISRHGFYALKTNDKEKEIINVRTLSDAKAWRIGSYLGSGIGEYLDSMGFLVDFAASNAANLQKLKASRIDLWASDTLSARFVMQQDASELLSPELVFFTTLRAIGCHREVEEVLIEELNTLLHQMYKEGSFDRIRYEFVRNLPFMSRSN